MIEAQGDVTGERTRRDEASETSARPLRGAGSEPVVLDIAQTKRQRRPTGAPAPLPKKIGLTGILWLGAAVVIVASGSIWLHVSAGPLDQFDDLLMRPIVAVRTGWLDSLARGLNSIGSRWGLAGLGLAAVALAIVFRRFRQLIVFVGSLALLRLRRPNREAGPGESRRCWAASWRSAAYRRRVCRRRRRAPHPR